MKWEQHDLPARQCCSLKMIPGSGVLSLKITRDGPTRVLQIRDIRFNLLFFSLRNQKKKSKFMYNKPTKLLIFYWLIQFATVTLFFFILHVTAAEI